MSSNIPKHVGLILDGNRRWARQNNLDTLEGHSKGYTKLKEIGEYLMDQGVGYVSAYIFSTENWKRTEREVRYLMDLVLSIFTEDIDEIHAKNIRLRFLGLPDRLSPEIMKAMKNAEVKTAGNTKGQLALCFNYGGRAEIVEAARIAAKKGDISEKSITDNLWAADIPDVDLLIRTSGEQRLSNFMLWRAAYSELYFVEKHWPAIEPADMDIALDWYKNRTRRFGGGK